MMKHCVRTLVVTLLLSFSTALAFAQTDTPKVEVGGQFSYLRLRDIPVPAGFLGSGSNDPGFGLRVGYNITNSLAAEAEFNYFGSDLAVPGNTLGLGTTSNVTYSSSRTQGLFGVKYLPLRGDKFGIGGKVRPGFVHFVGSAGTATALGAGSLGSQLIAGQIAQGYNSFAMDIGGVFEYYPSRHFVARMDLGDTIIRVKGFDPTFQVNGFTSNNIQLTVGFGFRF
jgi:outer membrane protein with beta-barrel domain